MSGKGGIGRRDFIHRMSATLGAIATTYRTVDLLDEAHAHHVARARAATDGKMTWLADVFPDNGELQQARRLGLELFENGDATTGYDVLLRGAMSHDRGALGARRQPRSRGSRRRDRCPHRIRLRDVVSAA